MVFRFQAEDAAASLLICHVLAQRNDVTERLLADFVKSVGRGDEPERVSCDMASNLCLWHSPSGRLRGRSYREVVIAPRGALPQVISEPVDTSYSAAQGFQNIGTMTALRQTAIEEVPEVDRPPGEDVNAAFDDAYYKRAESDWEFVAGQIGDAHRAGKVLDERFVETVARQRLERARSSYAYSDRPAAGPTFESSLGIVRSILNLHMAALAKYEGEGVEGSPGGSPPV